MGFEYSCDIKQCADQLLQENGMIVEKHWVGPVEVSGADTIVLWFKFMDRWYLAPFRSPWDKWDKESIDLQIANYMTLSEHEIKEYTARHPNIVVGCLSKQCECGAKHTLNSNCHSFWCPLYRKEK